MLSCLFLVALWSPAGKGCPGSGVVLDFIDFLSLPPYLYKNPQNWFSQNLFAQNLY